MARIQKQVRMVFDLNKCLGCHTCTMACKTMWTDGRLDLPHPKPNKPTYGLDPLVAPGGLLYQYWNNVESMPGRGYPRGVFTRDLGGGWLPNGRLNLNGRLPSISADYGDPWEYNYRQVLKTAGGAGGGRMLTPSPPPDGPNAYASNWDEDVGAGQHPNTFYFYLPRICNHCSNPACVASCPNKAAHKRAADGIVLIDQTRCQGYRMCTKACPYKKTYFNPEKKKTQKCIFCYPRIEQLSYTPGDPQPPRVNFCFNQCVGRIRFVGYYNPNLPPTHRRNINRNNVNRLIDKWRVALRLHPEFGTEPNLYYIPPLSPPTFSAGQLQPNTQRIPIDYLARLFGDNAIQTHAERVARVQEVFAILEGERAAVAAGGKSELVDILDANTEADRLQLHLG